MGAGFWEECGPCLEGIIQACWQGLVAQKKVEEEDEPKNNKSPNVLVRRDPRQPPVAPTVCGGCGCSTDEITRGARGTLLCRSCVRIEDESRLGPLSPEERQGLDYLAGILDSVSWKYWKPGEQPAEILDWLYLGDLHEAMDLDLLGRKGIGAVLNLIGWWELAALLPEGTSMAQILGTRGVEYEEADSEDRLFFDILGLSWPAAERFIESCRQQGRRVLVNCHAGHNRSACICVCWLVVREGMTLLEAVDRVQSRRGTVLSNHGFRLQLVRLALQLGHLGHPSSTPPGSARGMTLSLPSSPDQKPLKKMPVSVDASPSNIKIDRIINTKRLSVKYDHNSKDFSHKSQLQATAGKQLHKPPVPVRNKQSLLSAEVSGLLSQRKLSMELLACLVHWNRNFLDDYEYTQEPPKVIGTGFSGDVLLCRRRRMMSKRRPSIDKSNPYTLSYSASYAVLEQANQVDHDNIRQQRCVKRFKPQQMVPEHLEKLKNEAVIYLSLEHPLIARLFDVYEDEEEISLVMQYCSGGTLSDVLRTRGVFSECEFQEAAVQMLRVMTYIHRMGIVHRDIKPRNWVYEADGRRVKLIDFGFSAKQYLMGESRDSGIKGCMGTLGYLAPEVVKLSTDGSGSYTEKCDIWSLGTVFYEMLAGLPAFDREKGTCDGYTEEVVLRDIQEVTQDEIARLLEAVPGAARDFLRSLLTADPALRPSAIEALHHPYLAEARGALMRRPQALPVTEVLNRFRAYGTASAPTRAAMLALARSPTRLPWEDFCKLRATFELFDARDLNGTVNLEAFLSVVASGPFSDRVEEAREVWEAVCGGEESLSYCEFLAALTPPVEDAFEDVSTETVQQVTPGPSGQLAWDTSLPVSYFLPMIAPREKPIEEMVFEEHVPVIDVVRAMAEAHYRWVIIRYRNGRHEFFDYIDICHHLAKGKAKETASRKASKEANPPLREAMQKIVSAPVGTLANCSGYCAFVPHDESTPLCKVLHVLAHGRKEPGLAVGTPVHRLPIFNSSGKVIHVFSCLTFLELALRFEKPSAVLKSREARTFDRRTDVMEVSVPNDESVSTALRIMATEHLTICPATSRELSGDLGGAVATGVISVADLKWVMLSGQFHVLDGSLSDFIAWRSTIRDNSGEADRQRRLQRFNVVSVDRNETLHVLASRLVASQLQRIFLSSEEIARIVGIVSSRDILVEVADQLLRSTALSLKLSEQLSDSNPAGHSSTPTGPTNARTFLVSSVPSAPNSPPSTVPVAML